MMHRKVQLIITLVVLVAAGKTELCDSVPASRSHPGVDSIPLSRVPMFIILNFDDNGVVGKNNHDGLKWIRHRLLQKQNPEGSGQEETFDGEPVRAAFFLTTKYGTEDLYCEYPDVRKIWHKLYRDGNEIGNHSFSHLMKIEQQRSGKWVGSNLKGMAYSSSDWLKKEILPSHRLLTNQYRKTKLSGGLGIPSSKISGWRTPRFEWNDSLFTALQSRGYQYDCSMELELFGDGTSFWWPHTLNSGSPVYSKVSIHRGFWEIPAYPFVVPTALRSKVGDSVMTGLDYNVWSAKKWGGKELTAQEFTTILTYTLHQRMRGNRCPLSIGLHSDIYSSEMDHDYLSAGPASNRQKALKNFVDYALKRYPEVRFVTPSQLILWMKNPVGLQ